ncbi:iron-containing alcohol dehydrogenase [Maricurvus nonylphenolicus]|uniref:iron-containing alcohol dehydrogenase n=1 Tax=Maricurvus nonylphenolicus TaxID=1008307 RepID=UPI0036F3E860
MTSTIVLPKVMEVGAGAINKLADTLHNLGYTTPCIITDPMMQQLGYVDRISGLLSSAGIEAGVFADCIPEPTDSSIRAAVELVVDGNFDSLIALGGGSAIDSAKAIGILAKHGGDMREYKVPNQVTAAGIPVIAIPTTAGTGSEATRATIITDAASDEKMLCMGIGLMPIAAIIDYELTLSLPPRVTADTGIDALTHAIEAYVSRKANPFSDQQAIAAIKLLAPNLRTAFNEPENRPAREAMMLGATLAGIAFSNASVALVHGMSRPIGAHFHVPHGLSNAMLLPAVTEYSIPGAPERYADCARLMGVADVQDDTETANRKLLIELQALNKELQVPTLSEFGADKDKFFTNLQLMAEQALASGSPGNNPRVPSAEDVIELYTQVWG